MKHIFIINPAAGKGSSEKSILPEIIGFVKEHGADFEIHRSLNKAEIGSYVRTRASQGDPVRFYAVGGDGTICDVLNGLMGYPNAQLAIIPCGSGNDFVKNFTNTSYFLDLDRQVNGSVEDIDVIKYNDAYCMNMLNIGTDCDIVQRSGQLRKQKKLSGAASYAAAALEIVPRGTTYRFEYTDENGNLVDEDYMLVAIGNGKYCGGGFKSCVNASIRDGLMDIACVRLCTGVKLFSMLVKYRLGTYLQDREVDKYVRYMRVSEFTLTPKDKVNVSVDGEIEPFKETRIKVLPKAIKVVVPKGCKIID